MNAMPISTEPRELGRLLAVYWRRWATITLLATAAAVVYALVAPKTWQASQALIVRKEAGGGEMEPGRFRGVEDLKNVQETIVELARGRRVLAAALAEVGPPADYDEPSAWPTDNDLERLQKAVRIVPPKGTEFGASAVFYLEVRDKDRARVAALGSVLTRQLQFQLQEIRAAKAQSMIDELDKAVQVARADLQAATKQVSVLEKEVGSDLPELRSLLDLNSGDTMLRRTVPEIESELRQFRAAEKANRQLLALLSDAQANPTRLMAAPNRLLDSQPALKRLKEALVDAQLRTANLRGNMLAENPVVISAKEAETHVAASLHAELSTAIRGLEFELACDTNRVEMLEAQRKEASARLLRLAGLRSTYTNALSEVSNRAKLLDQAEQNLTNARSDSAGAKAASPIACVDAPDTGARPVSPGASVVVLAGLLGGLLIGFGVVFLTAPAVVAPQNATGEAVAPRTWPMPQQATPVALERRASECDRRLSGQSELHAGPEGLERTRQVQQRRTFIAPARRTSLRKPGKVLHVGDR